MSVDEESVNLLEFSPAGGCACKFPFERMNSFLAAVDQLIAGSGAHTEIHSDSRSRDDAALYKISDESLLALSVDFGTPVCQDATTWGAIAASNAVSDIYAVGAKPFLALSILGWPEQLSEKGIASLTAGAIEALNNCSTLLVGGHSIVSQVPIFGLCVIGSAHPNNVMLISNAEPGDHLIITKPIGTGILVASQKVSLATDTAITAAQELMKSSNREPSEIAVELGIDAATDITGYGLIGHLHNMLTASRCSAILELPKIPILPEVIDILNTHGVVPNSAERNYFAFEEFVEWSQVPPAVRIVLSDPQTSGGLLLAASPDQSEMLLTKCRERGILAVSIGTVVDGPPGAITVAC